MRYTYASVGDATVPFTNAFLHGFPVRRLTRARRSMCITKRWNKCECGPNALLHVDNDNDQANAHRHAVDFEIFNSRYVRLQRGSRSIYLIGKLIYPLCHLQRSLIMLQKFRFLRRSFMHIIFAIDVCISTSLISLGRVFSASLFHCISISFTQSKPKPYEITCSI